MGSGIDRRDGKDEMFRLHPDGGPPGLDPLLTPDPKIVLGER